MVTFFSDSVGIELAAPEIDLIQIHIPQNSFQSIQQSTKFIHGALTGTMECEWGRLLATFISMKYNRNSVLQLCFSPRSNDLFCSPRRKALLK